MQDRSTTSLGAELAGAAHEFRHARHRAKLLINVLRGRVAKNRSPVSAEEQSKNAKRASQRANESGYQSDHFTASIDHAAAAEAHRVEGDMAKAEWHDKRAQYHAKKSGVGMTENSARPTKQSELWRGPSHRPHAGLSDDELHGAIEVARGKIAGVKFGSDVERLQHPDTKSLMSLISEREHRGYQSDVRDSRIRRRLGQTRFPKQWPVKNNARPANESPETTSDLAHYATHRINQEPGKATLKDHESALALHREAQDAHRNAIKDLQARIAHHRTAIGAHEHKINHHVGVIDSIERRGGVKNSADVHPATLAEAAEAASDKAWETDDRHDHVLAMRAHLKAEKAHTNLIKQHHHATAAALHNDRVKQLGRTKNSSSPAWTPPIGFTHTRCANGSTVGAFTGSPMISGFSKSQTAQNAGAGHSDSWEKQHGGFANQDHARAAAREFAFSSDAARDLSLVPTHHNHEGANFPALEVPSRRRMQVLKARLDQFGVKYKDVGNNTVAVWHPSMKMVTNVH